MENSREIVRDPAVVSADSQSTDGQKRSLRRVIGSATAGTFIEYYDFAIYGALAPVLAHVFFPNAEPVVGLLSTFAVFAVAFVARPLGAFIWGPVGDRIGRKKTLSFIILLISIATVLIGLIPNYDSIGIIAPILLIALRLIQGISAGGELAGAALFVAEHAPDRKRGFLVSWLQVATTAAYISGISIAALVATLLPEESMQSWGWRIPFLLAGPVGVIGLYIRLKVDESPSFESAKNGSINSKETPSRRSEKTLKPKVWGVENVRDMVVAAAFYMPTMVSFYLLMTFMPTFLKKEMNFSAATALSMISIAGLIQMVAILLFAIASDSIGRRMMLRLTAGGFALLTYPAFLLLESGEFGKAIMGLILLVIPTAAASANSLTPALERFPTRIRFTSSAITLGLLVAIFGGTAPYISLFLTEKTGSPLAPGFYLILTVIPSLVASFFVRETANRPLVA
ncbi:MFS transporter [Rhodococcus sp. WS1]|uniref:MFS transporter n=1 Tax=unclassified Rhodococcus (in: high G+C Gram-positive bacteria) TaxID=192944 RepID=UPI001142BC3D|nr:MULTISPECIES: MFS transporter [unclassified Rhodococcus (in: high G+C Gram-positive bacteria)]ROZ52868.1 MFS transporter [Rhodococcus sp. WS1]TQC35958.1 MFS transporter [Rhodococcus sp. WS7]